MRSEPFTIRAEVNSINQLIEAANNENVEYIYAPVRLLSEDLVAINKDKIIVSPPVFLGGEEKLIKEQLIGLFNLGYRKMLANTLGHIQLGIDIGFQLYGGFRLNIANGLALKEYGDLGITDAIMSIELTADKLNELSHSVPVGIMAYGRLPLMLLRRCPIRDGKPCDNGKSCGKAITDRMGKKLDVICDNSVQLLNPDTMILSDKLDMFPKVNYFVLYLTDEENIDEIVNSYVNQVKFGDKLTRGLYFRGVR